MTEGYNPAPWNCPGEDGIEWRTAGVSRPLAIRKGVAMPGCAVWSRRFFTTLLLLVVIGGGIVGWRERSSLLAWFYIRNLARASEATRQRWVGRVANLGEVALPGLFDCLT